MCPNCFLLHYLGFLFDPGQLRCLLVLLLGVSYGGSPLLSLLSSDLGGRPMGFGDVSSAQVVGESGNTRWWSHPGDEW